MVWVLPVLCQPPHAPAPLQVRVTIKWGKVTHEGVELNTAAPALTFKQAVYALTGTWLLGAP